MMGRPAIHGHSKPRSPEYNAWMHMVARCCDPRHKQYAEYGGRGITVCERWRDSFVNFLRDMGERPSPEHSLDRIDNDGPYDWANCRWATTVQQRNNNRYCRYVIYRERRMSIADAARMAGIVTPRLALKRLHAGWDAKAAVETPRVEYQVRL
jgi:hypothetical protein